MAEKPKKSLGRKFKSAFKAVKAYVRQLDHTRDVDPEGPTPKATKAKVRSHPPAKLLSNIDTITVQPIKRAGVQNSPPQVAQKDKQSRDCCLGLSLPISASSP